METVDTLLRNVKIISILRFIIFLKQTEKGYDTYVPKFKKRQTTKTEEWYCSRIRSHFNRAKKKTLKLEYSITGTVGSKESRAGRKYVRC